MYLPVFNLQQQDIMIKKIFVLLVLLSGLSACQPEPETTHQRAHDPWVFRSVLDGQARMLTLALHDDLWAAYSAETANLYKVWKGGVNFDGAVYTTVHGPQPITLGKDYLVNTQERPWVLLQDGREQFPEVQFRGHRFADGQVTLLYDLLYDGGRIQVQEQPEFTGEAGVQAALQRRFEVKGVPESAELYLLTDISSVASERNIKASSTWETLETRTLEVEDAQTLQLRGRLLLDKVGPTTLDIAFTRPMLDNPNKVVGAEEEEFRPRGYRLIARNDCKTCHNTYVKTIGPAYVDVARKYRNTKENIAMLSSKVIKGGSGVWGEAVMNAHPDIPEEDVNSMVSYIMTLDADEEAEFVEAAEEEIMQEENLVVGVEGLTEEDLFPGAVASIYQYDRSLNELADLQPYGKAIFEGVIPELHAGESDLKGLEENFAIVTEGYFKIPKSTNYTFRLRSDDGSRLIIDGREIINHDGLHGSSARDGEIALQAGYHPFRVEYFQGLGGRSVSLQWRSFDSNEFEVMGSSVLMHHRDDQPKEGAATPPMAITKRIPGDTYPLTDVHPSYDLSQARPKGFAPKVGGMDFLSDGRMVISTWDAEGGVYILENVQSGDPEQIRVKQIAKGLAEPLGLKVVDDEIYVLQKQELTRLIDHDGDEIIDEYRTLSNAWQVSANFHEFAFGLAYKEGWFYGALAIAILPGGASANPQISDRGKIFRVNRESGAFELVAEGLRTPNGVGIGKDGEVFVADNQGDWLPASKIMHVTEGAFFGSRAVDSARVAQREVKLPVVWLPQNEIGNSPSTPSYLQDGRYAGQMIHGEVTHGGIKRVFVEEVEGAYQGAVFRFIQGLESGVNRLTWGPDGALYIGGVGSTGNWQHTGKLWYGLQRLKYNEQPAFEMLAVRARSNGLEIEFTEPLEEGLGWDTEAYDVQQWRYEPTAAYGGPKLDLEQLPVLSASVSEDRRKVLLELANMKENRVIYVRLPVTWTSSERLELWSTEAWYTMNRIPSGNPIEPRPAPSATPDNTLSDTEREQGWELLFDGESLAGWHNYLQDSVGRSWTAENGTLHLKADQKGENGWQVASGGDIVYDKSYEDFELRLEWKISSCGNSGIMYHVVESEDYDYPWMTGPEMQVLDNACHPDAKIEKHKAGDLYDLKACKYITVNPAGEWNSVRICFADEKLEHWLNGRKVVETEVGTAEWKRMVQNSKWKDYPDFGESRSGKIALQDHGDPVWFRNIKIRPLH